MPAADVEAFFDGKSAADGTGMASDSPTEPEQKSEKPEAGAAPDPVVAKQEAADEEDEKEEQLPDDRQGLLKAIASVRGDRRYARKKWREVEKELQEERRQREEERQARARLEGELNSLRQFATKQQAKPTTTEKAPDPEELFWQKGPGAFISEREQQLMAKLEQQLADRERREFERDRARMRRTHEDYEAAEAAFKEAAANDPSLFAKAEQSGDALYYVYQHGKELQRLKEYGPVNSVAELEAKIREKLEAELRGQPSTPAAAPSQPPAKPPIPTKSIASARGTSVGVTRDWSGPRPAETFFTGPRI